MANEEHLKVLKRGVVEWNEWRSKNKDIKPDLRGADLRESNLREADLHSANLKSVVLHGADLSDAVLNDDYLDGADLSYANLSDTNLSGTFLRGAVLSRAGFSGTILNSANLISADLSEANFSDAVLHHAILNSANLTETDLHKADLRKANLVNAILRRADLRNASLSGATLSYADLNGADLNGADLKDSRLYFTVFGDTNLKTARNLDSCKHIGPSIIDQMTLVRSGGLPEVFLKGCGLSDDFIQQIPFLFWEKAAFEFYSCFISYSSKDEDFAERLHADLQSKGVRCWFAPDDMKIGDKIRPTIDESIRIYDKLLLILSENSVNSQWVEQEFETALRKERQQNSTVLFPVRLDETVMNIEVGWPALVKDTHHIGNFTNWKDHDAYKKAFERLMRDLKAS